MQDRMITHTILALFRLFLHPYHIQKKIAQKSPPKGRLKVKSIVLSLLSKTRARDKVPKTRYKLDLQKGTLILMFFFNRGFFDLFFSVYICYPFSMERVLAKMQRPYYALCS